MAGCRQASLGGTVLAGVYEPRCRRPDAALPRPGELVDVPTAAAKSLKDTPHFIDAAVERHLAGRAHCRRRRLGPKTRRGRTRRPRGAGGVQDAAQSPAPWAKTTDGAVWPAS
jgi:hypothetical protein